MLERAKTYLKPYEDIIIFVITLLVANYFWKWTMSGDESGVTVSWLGLDITPLFAAAAQHVADVSYHLCRLFTDDVRYIEPYIIRFDSGSGLRIIWGCTGIKQSFIWLCLMLTAKGIQKRKLWYIPLGWLCIYLFNILRIVFVALVIKDHPDLFELLHTYIFKYLFYFMLFMLWVWWTESVGQPHISANGQ